MSAACQNMADANVHDIVDTVESNGPEIEASNGVTHAIDSVLMPPA
jgi:uncharacterized surface protein with fasciclin (FAS1) repeats